MNHEDVSHFDRAAFERAHERLRVAPIELTDGDFTQLAIVSTQLEETGREAQRLAQLAIVRKNLPLDTKASSDDRSRRPVLQKHLTQFADQFGDVVVDVIKRTADPLKQQLKELKDQNADLTSRVLELEARDAARTAVLHDH